MELRARVSKALEESRQEKQIGNSLEAKVQIQCSPETFEYLQSFSQDLRFLFIVSDIELRENSEMSGDQIEVFVSKASGAKCERCWTYTPSVGSHADLPTIFPGFSMIIMPDSCSWIFPLRKSCVKSAEKLSLLLCSRGDRAGIRLKKATVRCA